MNKETFVTIRQTLAYTQAAFALELGVTRETVARYESGDRKIPKTVELLIYCKFPQVKDL